MEVEDRLATAFSDADENAVVVETGVARRVGDEVEHALRLVGRELADLAEGRDVPLGQDEQVRVGQRIDVADRDEAIALRNVVAFPDEPAEEAVLRQRGSPPPRRPRREPG